MGFIRMALNVFAQIISLLKCPYLEVIPDFWGQPPNFFSDLSFWKELLKLIQKSHDLWMRLFSSHAYSKAMQFLDSLIFRHCAYFWALVSSETWREKDHLMRTQIHLQMQHFEYTTKIRRTCFFQRHLGNEKAQQFQNQNFS